MSLCLYCTFHYFRFFLTDVSPLLLWHGNFPCSGTSKGLSYLILSNPITRGKSQNRTGGYWHPPTFPFFSHVMASDLPAWQPSKLRLLMKTMRGSWKYYAGLHLGNITLTFHHYITVVALANICIYAQQADTEQHQYSLGVILVAFKL